ncbi:outer membrane receptor for monomeric catechols [Parabacteroides sp. PM5-20]|uniref:TonB-dependent receptor plug domain-containing protein n=1 Tax=unclassified Parabacteroides TaxID=2649774 RepID=UPI0013D577D7|nr:MULTISPECIES: TonB-dependent receptor plug domain-containing protein [unclassified Parabacteroides]MDH6535553.1 outer membrane receptor for monomeric catechols [Parabacteroides sp. PM5-20]
MKKLLLILVSLLFLYPIYGQDRNVSGLIVTREGKPAKGVKVSVLDTRISTKTNKNGEFRLRKLRSDDSILVQINKDLYARFLLGENERVKLVLSDDLLTVEQEKGQSIPASLLYAMHVHENRSVSFVNSRMIKRSSAITLVDVIKEMLPGVIIQTDEDTGQISATMRGKKSLNMSNESLVILDGTETTIHEANHSVEAGAIESIEVIKDGFGYGVKGSNGVIVIKTKI